MRDQIKVCSAIQEAKKGVHQLSEISPAVLRQGDEWSVDGLELFRI